MFAVVILDACLCLSEFSHLADCSPLSLPSNVFFLVLGSPVVPSRTSLAVYGSAIPATRLRLNCVSLAAPVSGEAAQTMFSAVRVRGVALVFISTPLHAHHPPTHICLHYTQLNLPAAGRTSLRGSKARGA